MALSTITDVAWLKYKRIGKRLNGDDDRYPGRQTNFPRHDEDLLNSVVF